METFKKRLAVLFRRIFYFLPAAWRIRISGKASLLYYDAGYGDSFMAAAVAREVKKKFGKRIKVRVNRLKEEIVRNNPFIDEISEGYYGIDLNYHKGADRLTPQRGKSIIEIMSKRAGIDKPENRVDIFFNEDEQAFAREKMSGFKKPVVSIQTTPGGFGSNRKSWPAEYWEELCVGLSGSGIIPLQLGGDKDIRIVSADQSFCGKIDIRKSIALIKEADLHVGIISSLMHGAAAVGTKSVIIYGGFERRGNHKYKDVYPVESDISCAPCWVSGRVIEVCDNDLECMKKIKPEYVLSIVMDLLQGVDVKGHGG